MDFFPIANSTIYAYLQMNKSSFKHITLDDSDHSDHTSLPMTVYDYVGVNSTTSETTTALLHTIIHHVNIGSVIHVHNWYTNMPHGPLQAVEQWLPHLKHIHLHPLPLPEWNERAFVVCAIDDYDVWSDT